MKRSPVTLRDIAEAAGVSVSTVSLVLNDRAREGRVRISERTVRTVQEIAAAMDYSPNLAARAMSLGRTTVVGLVLFEIRESASQLRTLEGISSVLKGARYNLAAGMMTQGDPELELQEIGLMLQKGFDCILLEASIPLLERTQRDPSSLPGLDRILLLNRPSVGGIPAASVDEEKSGYLATRHLLDLGHRSVAYLGACPSEEHHDEELMHRLNPLMSRRQGYLRAMEEFGSEPREAPEVALIDRLRKDGVTGAYCSRSWGATDLLGFCQDRGVRVPEDLSIVGHADAREKRVTRPPITTVDLRPFEVGTRAGRMALDLVEGKAVQNNIVEPELIVRGSTCALH